MTRAYSVVLLSFVLIAAGCNLSDEGGGMVGPGEDSGNNTEIDGGTEDGGPNVTPGDPCDTLECENGTCVVESGVGLCRCETGFGGDLCDRCEDGRQDNDGDGICEIDCVTAELECGEAECSDALGTAICTCPEGLAFLPQSGTCDVSGILGGENFAESSDSYSSFGNGMFDPDYMSEDGTPGGFVVPADATCDPGGTGFERTITLGSKEDVGELILDLDFVFGGDCRDFCSSTGPIFIQVGNAIWTVVPDGFGPVEDFSTCLPDTAYDNGEVTVRVWSELQRNRTCPTSDSRSLINLEAIENLSLRRPADGESCATADIPDTDFEAGMVGDDPMGWEVFESATAPVSIQQSAGNQFLQLEAINRCATARVSTETVIPAPTDPSAGMALRFDQTTAPDPALLRVVIGSNNLTFTGADTNTSPKVCIPAHQVGTKQTISFSMGTGGLCADVINWRSTIDNLRFEEDPNCATDGVVGDGAFDGNLPGAWTRNAFASNDIQGRALVEKGEELMNPYAQLSLDGACAGASVRQWLTPDSATQNAVEFRYRFITSGTVDTRGTIGANSIASFAGISQQFDPTVNWTPQTVCLPDAPRLPFLLTIGIAPVSGTCAVTFDREFLLIDDVELVESMDCDMDP